MEYERNSERGFLEGKIGGREGGVSGTGELRRSTGLSWLLHRRGKQMAWNIEWREGARRDGLTKRWEVDTPPKYISRSVNAKNSLLLRLGWGGGAKREV